MISLDARDILISFGSLLIGMDGQDILIGMDGQDILIGMDGQDILISLGGQGILISLERLPDAASGMTAETDGQVFGVKTDIREQPK